MQLSCTEGDGERKAGGESRDKLELVLISAVSGPCTAALGRGDTVIALCSVPASSAKSCTSESKKGRQSVKIDQILELPSQQTGLVYCKAR